jgi:hypothetical protein
MMLRATSFARADIASSLQAAAIRSDSTCQGPVDKLATLCTQPKKNSKQHARGCHYHTPAAHCRCLPGPAVSLLARNVASRQLPSAAKLPKAAEVPTSPLDQDRPPTALPAHLCRQPLEGHRWLSAAGLQEAHRVRWLVQHHGARDAWDASAQGSGAGACNWMCHARIGTEAFVQ